MTILWAHHVGSGGESYFVAWHPGKKAECVTARHLTMAIGRLITEQPEGVTIEAEKPPTIAE